MSFIPGLIYSGRTINLQRMCALSPVRSTGSSSEDVVLPVLVVVAAAAAEEEEEENPRLR